MPMEGIAVSIDPITLGISIPLQYPYKIQDVSLDFGLVNIGEEACLDFEIVNSNSTDCFDSMDPICESIYVFNITQSNTEEFTVEYLNPPINDLYWLLHPGDSLPIEVTFIPNSPGEKTMELTINFNGANTQMENRSFTIKFTAEGQVSLSPPWRYRHKKRVNQNYSMPENNLN